MKKKFSAAWQGLRDASGHRSVQVQGLLAAAAVLAGFLLQLTAAEWIAVVLCIGLVLASELLNTCIEKLCDLYSTAPDPRIRVIKDIAAGAVLTAALTALVAAAMIAAAHIG
jgi:diacylglycerol kinase